jgi:hypothetical protein
MTDKTPDSRPATEPLIIHHRGCADGICGAMVIWLGLGRRGELRAAQYGEPPPDVEEVAGREVWIVDFSYPREVLLRLHETARALVVLDHHKTAEASCRGLPFCTFDMERSGARLALDRLDMAPNWTGLSSAEQVAIEAVVDYVEDRDLWRFDLPHSQEINAYLASWPRTLDAWVAILDRIKGKWAWADIVGQGTAILRRERQLVEIMCGNARPMRGPGPDRDSERLLLVNAPVLQSEVAGELAARDGVDYAVAWWQRSDGQYQYSLRSTGGLDVAAIAQEFGGGGHAQAAGFTSDLAPFYIWAVGS